MPRRRLCSFTASSLRVTMIGCALGALTGCAGTATPNGPTALPIATVVETKPPSAKGTTRRASDALAKHWPTATVPLAIYADLDGLFKTKVIGGFVTILTSMLAKELTAPQRTCVEQLVPAAKELAIAMAEDDGKVLYALRVDPAATGSIGRCLEAFDRNVKSVSIAGATEAWRLGDDAEIAVARGGIVLLGAPRTVTMALTMPGDGAGLKRLTLGEGEYVTWALDLPQKKVSSSGTFLVTDQELRLSGELDVGIEREAKGIAEALRPSKLRGLLPLADLGTSDAASVKRLVDALQIDRDGSRVTGRFELRGSPAEVARDLGAGAVVGVYAMRKYITNAKQAEAKNAIGQLARLVVMSWESEGAIPHAKKKLTSFPAVPKTVPRGVKHQTSEADWKPYAPLHFEMGVPQYFQYEIKAAKDGESAEIIARGDLNGDGKTSQFRILLKVDRPESVIRVSPSIEETDPDE